MTAPPPMLSPSSILPTISSQCHVILARKNPARDEKMSFQFFALFKQIFAIKLHKFKLRKLRISVSLNFGYPDEVGDSLLYRQMLTSNRAGERFRRRVTKMSTNFEKLLSLTDGNFEQQNKVWESSIIIINYGIIIFMAFL